MARRSCRRRPAGLARHRRVADRRSRCSSGRSSSSAPTSRDGWALAGTIVPIAYIAWSIWLIADRVLLAHRMRTTDYDVRPAGVAELVDAADLNSAGRKAVRVRISAPVPRSASKRHLWRSGTLTFVLWQDFDAMTAIIGPNWREPSWLPGLGEAIDRARSRSSRRSSPRTRSLPKLRVSPRRDGLGRQLKAATDAGRWAIPAGPLVSVRPRLLALATVDVVDRLLAAWALVAELFLLARKAEDPTTRDVDGRRGYGTRDLRSARRACGQRCRLNGAEQ